MSNGFEIPNHDTLVAEQAVVQAEKFQGRLLREYNDYMFPGQTWREPRGSAVADFVRPLVGYTEPSIEAILHGIGEVKQNQPVSWVDMGGGRSLPMRQLASAPDKMPCLQMTNVDLFNFGLEGLEPNEIEYLEELVPGVTKPQTEPTLIRDNVETVVLNVRADIITSVEAMQYLNNPLEALANWYNQLSDNGIMIVATEHDWASWIRYKREPSNSERDEAPTKHMLGELTSKGVNFAATNETDQPNGRPRFDPSRFRIMAVQKKPGTSLRVTQPVTEVWTNPHKFKAAYYEVPTNGSSPIVEVVRSKPYTSLGATTLRSIS